MSTGFNAATWLVDRHVEAGRGDHVAVRSALGPDSLSYAALAEHVADVAGGLRDLGLRRDDRVVFVSGDSIAMLTGILACFRAGLVAVPVSTMLSGRELGEIIGDSGAQVVVVSADFTGQVEDALRLTPAVRTVISTEEIAIDLPDGVDLRGFDSLASAGSALPRLREAAATTDDSSALWLYTSGTTGQPKGAMHRHANIRAVCDTYGAQVLGIRPDDVCLSVAKLFFAYGIGNSLFFPFSVGATTVLESRRPTPALVGELVATRRPTLFFGVPTFYAALLASDLPDDTFASVRLATSAGEPLPAALLERFASRFGVEIIDGIGSTEELHIFLSNRPGRVRAGTTGEPVPGYEIALRDPAGAPVPDGQPGSLYVRGESMATGYWRRTDASRTVFQGEWLNTGDTYVRSEDGFYTCLGRSNDLIKAGGIWVSPAEVEARLLQHPAVLEVAVIGVPDADGLDKPVAAVVVGSTPVTTDELIAFARDGLAHFKAPRRVVVVDDLPKTATGKMQRYKVRQLFAADLVVPQSSAGVPS